MTKYKKYKKLIGGSEITKEHDIYLYIANQAYTVPEERAKKIHSFYSEKPLLYNKEISTRHEAVYVDTENLVVIIGYRGTKILDTKNKRSKIRKAYDAAIDTGYDMFSNIFIASGIPFSSYFSPRYYQSLAKAEEVISLYPEYTIQHTGHSLGGKLAMEVGLSLPFKDSHVVAFNPGSTPVDYVKIKAIESLCSKYPEHDYCLKWKNQIIYYTKGDLISTWNSFYSRGINTTGKDDINDSTLTQHGTQFLIDQLEREHHKRILKTGKKIDKETGYKEIGPVTRDNYLKINKVSTKKKVFDEKKYDELFNSLALGEAAALHY